MMWNTAHKTASFILLVALFVVHNAIGVTSAMGSLEQSTTTPREVTGVGVSLEGIVSTRLWLVFGYVVDLWICSILSYLGIVTNVLTILVFSKMGFRETVNISMTAIAAWDLAKCVCVMVVSLNVPIKASSLGLGLSWRNVASVIFRNFNGIAGYASGALAVYVAVERCLCVSMPLVVKSIITRKIASCLSVTISLCVPASYVVIYAVYDFVELTDASTNETYLMFQFNAFEEQFPAIRVYYSTVSMLYPLATLCIMVVCTATIGYHLRKATQIRSEIKADDVTHGPSHLSSRDRQVIKMLVVVILVYIVCIVPKLAFFIAMTLIPDFNVGRRYDKLAMVCIYIFTVFDLINASINIFIFYSMSSQFKSKMIKMFQIDKIMNKLRKK